MPWKKLHAGYTKAHAKQGRGGFVRNAKQYEALRRKGMSKEQAAAITNSDNLSKYLTDAQIKHRKRIAADLGLASAGFGLAALGSRGAEGALRLKGATKAAEQLHSATGNALVAGTGVGAAGAINSAIINRTEAKQRRPVVTPVKTSKPKKPKKEVIPKSLAPIGQANQLLGGKPKKKMIEISQPKVRQAVAGVLRNVNAGKNPDMMTYFPNAVPGGKKIAQLDTSLNGVQKGLKQGLAEGYRLASRPAGAVRQSARSGEAMRIMGRKSGAAAHDFRAGYSRRIHAVADIDSGKTTEGHNAVYPWAHSAGTWTRRIGAPVVVVGGSYKAGKTYGAHRQRKKQVAKGATMQGQLVPIYKAYKPGTITYHQEQANLHSRKKSGARRQIAGGVMVGTVGGAAMGSAPHVADRLAPKAQEVGTVARNLKRAKIERNVFRGGAGVALGGAALAGVGVGRYLHHGHQQNRHTQLAQSSRRARNSTIGKRSAYDSEESRHNRNMMYTGAAATGSAGAAAVAAHQGKVAIGHIKRVKPAKAAGYLRMSERGFKPAGRAGGALVGAGALAYGAHKIHQKSQRQGDWY